VPKLHKTVLNFADQHKTPNIGGFNIFGFRPRFFEQFQDDVVRDYEQTFVGVFVRSLFHLFTSLGYHRSLELSFSVTLFQQDSGYSLAQGDEQEESVDAILPPLRQFNQDRSKSQKRNFSPKTQDQQRVFPARV